ncbi:MAG: hypothetical protein JWQ42_2343 [Edaphobacter sp.]|nr:hypothetical protein [Edaphobacter sp.]
MSLPGFTSLLISASLLLVSSLLPAGCLVLDSTGLTVPVVIDKLKFKILNRQHAVAGASNRLYVADLSGYTCISVVRLTNSMVTGKDDNYIVSSILVCNLRALFRAGGSDDSFHSPDNHCKLLRRPLRLLPNRTTTVTSTYTYRGSMSSLTGVSAMVITNGGHLA